MAVRVNMHEAKTTLSKLVEMAEHGEEVVICRAGKPAVRLVAEGPTDGPRPMGLAEGQIWYADDWDSDETNSEIAALFEDGPIFPDEG
jgi:prevent-host-death family protein